MSTAIDSPYGIGIYTVPEAALLSGVRAQRLRRWLAGYEYESPTGDRRKSAALWARELPPLDDGQLMLSFRDLVEAKWIHFFRDQHVSWQEIRDVAARAAEELNDTHPFSTGRFAAIVKGKKAQPKALIAQQLPGRMREVLSDQYNLDRVMTPFVRQLEFRNDRLVRWFPLHGSRRVLLDPQVRFGAPIVKSGVPTEILWRNHHFGRATYRALARWWDIPEAEVKDAVRWESNLRAA